MRLARPLLLLALAALLAPRIEASRGSVWESNPPAFLTATRADAAGLLASLAPAAPTDIEAEEPHRFDLGDITLVESAREHEGRFNLGPLTLVDLNLLRGPPSSYPETRVGGFELLPPFRVGASPTLSLWGRQACGFSCREVASDSRYDPWGLCLGFTDGPCSAVADSIKGAFEGAKDAVRSGLGSGAGSVAIDAVVSTGLDVVDAFLVDPLRAGEATGDAIGRGAGGVETTLAVVQDIGRGAAIAAGAGSVAKAAGRGAKAVKGSLALGDDYADVVGKAMGEGAAEGISEMLPAFSRRARGRFPQNALEGGAREGAAIAELNPNPGRILEQRTIFDEGGRALFQGKGRRLDAVRVEDGLVTEALEITSPGEAMRARKIRQIFRGDELIAREGTFVLGLNGERIPFAPGLRTTVITRR